MKAVWSKQKGRNPAIIKLGRYTSTYVVRCCAPFFRLIQTGKYIACQSHPIAISTSCFGYLGAATLSKLTLLRQLMPICLVPKTYPKPTTHLKKFIMSVLSKRLVMSPQQVAEFYKLLLDTIECPVCKIIPRAHVFQCQRGHLGWLKALEIEKFFFSTHPQFILKCL